MSSYKFEEVCNFCYKLSSHKASPTYTFRNKASGDPLTCTVCRQKWQSQIVARIPSGKVFPVRPRPAIPAQVDYTYCVSITKGIHCFKGPQCTFAHHEGELIYWCQERARKEPRPNPSSKSQQPYTICKAVQEKGLCNYGVRCTFAHSEEELQLWKRRGGSGVPFHPPPPGGGAPYRPPFIGGGAPYLQPPTGGGAAIHRLPAMGGGGVGNTIFFCHVCNVKCTGQKQLDEHKKGSLHQKSIKMMEAPPEPLRPMAPMRHVFIRPRPVLNFQIDGYRICMHASRGRHCQYGDACTFAHSPEELDAWNQELRVSRQRPPLQMFLKKTQVASLGKDSSKPPVGMQGGIPNGGALGVPPRNLDGLDDFEDDLSDVEEELEGEDALEGEPIDVADEARLRLDSLWRQNQDASKLMGPTQGVFVQEVSGTPLALKMARPMQDIGWTFQVTVQAPKKFKSVVLYDVLGEEFILHPLVRYRGGQSFTVGGVSLKDGKGEEVNQVIQPGETMVVKVSVRPATGIKEQVVVFLFADFLIVQPLKVEVLSEEAERGLRLLQRKAARKPVKKDLYWEYHYHVLEYIPDLQEPTDSSLKEYKLPEKIEQFIEEKRYDNMERTITRENYVRRLHNLLFLEEYQQRSDMSRYDLIEVAVEFVTNYNHGEQLNIAPAGTAYLKLEVEEELFEGRRSIKPGDVALMLPVHQKNAFGCAVEHVGREYVVLKVSSAAKEQCGVSGNKASFRFTVQRTSFKAMHYAMDCLDLDVIFPTITGPVPLAFRTQECLRLVDKCSLNKAQKDAVRNVLDPAYQSIPTLVCGPFGCGKTRTLRECIRLLLQHSAGTKILLTTQSNSAADLYVEDLDKELNGQLQQKVYRLYYIGRNPRTVSRVVMKYTKFENGHFVCPDIETLKKYRLIVTTLQTARTLKLKGFKKDYFTHIFIDEVAQALEAEALIPLSMANKVTKLVLAGDKMQMNPSVYSSLSRKYGLGQSLLDRLYDDDVYRQKAGLPCKVELNENHRSHPQILEVPSKLFYSNCLVAKATFPLNGPQDIPPVGFVGVDGQEKRDEDSPSFLNLLEAEKVAAKAEEFCKHGLKPREVCVLTLYKRQVEIIRWLLRQKKLAEVSVLNIEGVQGLEYRALLLSTVRTCTVEPGDSDEGSFLSSPKLFNTAITRACQWLLVVGEPITLCSVGSNRTCWLEFIKKCISLDSFVYPSPQRFEAYLENRLITKHIVQAIKSADFQPSEGEQTTETDEILLESFSKLDLRARRTVIAERVGCILENAPQEDVRNVTDHLMYKYSTAEPLVRLLNNQTELKQTVLALNPQSKHPDKTDEQDDTDASRREEVLGPHPVSSSVGPTAPLEGATSGNMARLQNNVTISNTLPPRPAQDMQPPVASLPAHANPKLQQVSSQLSLLLHQERSLILQQKGLLQQLSPVEMPQEVHPKLQRANELLQQQIKLLDEQTTVMAELMRYFPMAQNVGMVPGPRAFSGPSHQLTGPFQRVPLRPFSHFGPVPRMPMGMGMSAMSLPRPQAPGSMRHAPQSHHDLDWDDL